jgi:hypothetical protein
MLMMMLTAAHVCICEYVLLLYQIFKLVSENFMVTFQFINGTIDK